MIELIPATEIVKIITELKVLSKEQRLYYEVSENFFWNEFFSGDPIKGVKSVEPPESMWTDAITHILYMQRVRDYLGFAVGYSSGYRTKVWNKIWKGAKDSDHLYCRAGDMVPKRRISIYKFAMIIAMLTPLDHFGAYNGWSKWVHAGNNEDKQLLYKW